jgi:hypothetical protein
MVHECSLLMYNLITYDLSIYENQINSFSIVLWEKSLGIHVCNFMFLN